MVKYIVECTKLLIVAKSKIILVRFVGSQPVGDYNGTLTPQANVHRNGVANIATNL